MLFVLFKNYVLLVNSLSQIKLDECRNYEVYVECIFIMLEGEYKGFQVLNIQF